MTTSRSAVDESVATVGSSIDRLLPSSARPRVARELALMTILFLVYRQIRYLTRDDVDVAFSNARRVVEVERFVGVFNEAAVQDMVMNHDVVIRFFNHYYALVHFPITALFVIWVLVRHPDSYRRIRTWIVSVTAAALAIHVGFPLAPPRMLDREDFVDTLATYGPHIYSVNTEQSVANQFAAMPSLHFGWAVIVAAGFVGIHRSRISRIAFIHPIITLLAIVATANHYWVDAAVALCIVAGAHHLLNHNTAPIWSPSSARHQTRLPRTSWARIIPARTSAGSRRPAQRPTPDAINVPPDQVDRLAAMLLPDREAAIVVYCSGTRENSEIAARRLEELGYGSVRVHLGGKEDWVEHGLPVERTSDD